MINLVSWGFLQKPMLMGFFFFKNLVEHHLLMEAMGFSKGFSTKKLRRRPSLMEAMGFSTVPIEKDLFLGKGDIFDLFESWVLVYFKFFFNLWVL